MSKCYGVIKPIGPKRSVTSYTEIDWSGPPGSNIIRRSKRSEIEHAIVQYTASPCPTKKTYRHYIDGERLDLRNKLRI